MTVVPQQEHSFVRGFIALLVIPVLLLLSVVSQAAVDLRVDRDSVKLGETITLVVETADINQSLDIDVSLLTEDFHFIDTRSESSRSFVNGKQSVAIRVLYVLEPKRVGKLTIPSFKLGDVSTAQLEITVEIAPVAAAGEPPLVFMEVESNTDSIYVHSQLVLTVKLYYRYNLTGGNLPDPQIEHATVVKLGETSINATRNGVSYRALERVYAVFPERSGELIIPEISFSGQLRKPSTQGGSLFAAAHNRRQRVRVASEAFSIDVKPRPAQYPAGADWLPARQLVVNSQIKTANGGARVGEPITRVIEMKAVGLLDTMFPEIQWPPMDKARVYPDTPESVSRNAGQWVTGRKVHSFAVVPETTGELLLPEISIPWWDTIEDKLKVALVPAEIVDIQPALGEPVDVQAAVMPTPVAETIPATEQNKPVNNLVSGAEKSGWQILAITGFSLWLLTLLLWWRNRNNSPVTEETTLVRDPHENALRRFKNACGNNQALAAATALRQFAVHKLGIVDGLSGLEKQCVKDGFEPLAENIEALNRQLYAQITETDSSNWNGSDLYQQFNLWLKAKAVSDNKKPDSKSLPPFYPQ
ncbi:MAG: BatD family protein [Xanthomonadales bacterium]|nr:BatD family protein [Xanthomonadales bacterium]